MLTPGLRIRRQINPSSDLLAWLENQRQVEEIEDKKGKAGFYIDDGVPRPPEITMEIVDRCTVRFVIFDDDNEVHYATTSASKAERALRGATVTFHTDIDVADLPEADPEPEEDDSDLIVPDDPPKWPKAKH